jgi:DNA-binding transcriptional MerR regulator
VSDDDTLLTSPEVAQMLGVRVPMVSLLTREGLLAAVPTPGRHRRYTYAAVRACLEARRPIIEEAEARQRRAAIAVQLREQGCTIAEIAAKFDMSHSEIHRILKRHNAQRGPAHPMKDAVATYLLQGYTLKKAEQLAQWEQDQGPERNPS